MCCSFDIGGRPSAATIRRHPHSNNISINTDLPLLLLFYYYKGESGYRIGEAHRLWVKGKHKIIVEFIL